MPAGVAPAPAWTADVWTAEDQAAFFRANPPRVEGLPPWTPADEVIAEAVRRVTPRGCYAIVRLGPDLYPCANWPVAGRCFCAEHAHLGWCERACAWRPPRLAAVRLATAPPVKAARAPVRTTDPRPRRQKPPPPVIPPDRSAPPPREPGPPLAPLPARTWRRVMDDWTRVAVVDEEEEPWLAELAKRADLRRAAERLRARLPVAVWASAAPGMTLC